METRSNNFTAWSAKHVMSVMSAVGRTVQDIFESEEGLTLLFTLREYARALFFLVVSILEMCSEACSYINEHLIIDLFDETEHNCF